MKLMIIYHSGAGSTKYTANCIYEYIKEYYETEILPIEECENLNINEYDRVVIGFPTIHAAPSPNIIKFITNMSKSKKKIPIYIFTTCGLYPANSLRKFAQLCISKNLMTVDSCYFRCPASDGVLLLPKCKAFHKFQKNYNKKLNECCQEMIMFFNKTNHTFKMPKWQWYSILNYPNMLAGQYLFKPTVYVNDKLCTGCKKCIRDCANKCLSYENDKIVFDSINCEHCYRCIHHCPKGALSLKKDGCTKIQLNEKFFEAIGK